MSISRSAFVALLVSQAGYREGHDPDGTWNNVQRFSAETPGLTWSQGMPYCATFQAWGAHKLGADTMWPMTASCYTAVQWWQDHARWTQYPVLGGPFYLGPGGSSHTGVVTAYGPGWIETIEANTNDTGAYQGNGVYVRKRPRTGAGSPFGYGVPAFIGGTISADPGLPGTYLPEAHVTPEMPQVPTVHLAHILAAARRDPDLPQGGTTYPTEVRIVESALQGEGMLAAVYASDGSWGTKTKPAYAAWQRSGLGGGYSGAAADGYPGMDSLRRLGARHRFTVLA